MPATSRTSARSLPSQRRAPSLPPVTLRRTRPAAPQAARPAPSRPAASRPLVEALRETVDADDFGVIWLDCGGRPIREALDALVELAAELEGDVSVLDQTATYAVALVRLPPPAFTRFRGALALAGGAVVEGSGANDVSETVFLVSQSS